MGKRRSSRSRSVRRRPALLQPPARPPLRRPPPQRGMPSRWPASLHRTCSPSHTLLEPWSGLLPHPHPDDAPAEDSVGREEGDRVMVPFSRRRNDMRVMLMIKGDPEPGAAPSEELLAAMGSYNDELKKAGVLLDLAGLYPSGEGKRVRF